MLKKLIPFVIMMVALVPQIGNAQQSQPMLTYGNNVATVQDFTANYTFAGSYAQQTDVYFWWGEYASQNDFSAWSRTNFLVRIPVNNQTPIPFSAQLNFASSGIQDGKIYGYTLANQTSTNDPFFIVQPGTNIVRCFTKAGDIPCPVPTSPGGGGGATGEVGGSTQQTPQVNIEIVSVTAPTTSTTIRATAFTENGTLTNSSFKLNYGKALEPFSGTQDLYSGPIPPDGVSFSVTLDNLTFGEAYKYEIFESVTGASASGTFQVGEVGNQANALNQTLGGFTGSGSGGTGDYFSPGGSNARDGVCGTVNGGTFATKSLFTGTLCAAGSPSQISGNGPWTWTCSGNGGGTANCSANIDTGDSQSSNFLKNPLAPGLNTFPKIFAAVYNGIILPVAIPFIAIAIMYSGFLFVIARKEGSTIKLDQAKAIFKWTMIGSALLLGGFVIANALQSTLCELLNNCTATPPTP